MSTSETQEPLELWRVERMALAREHAASLEAQAKRQGPYPRGKYVVRVWIDEQKDVVAFTLSTGASWQIAIDLFLSIYAEHTACVEQCVRRTTSIITLNAWLWPSDHTRCRVKTNSRQQPHGAQP